VVLKSVETSVYSMHMAKVGIKLHALSLRLASAVCFRDFYCDSLNFLFNNTQHCDNTNLVSSLGQVILRLQHMLL